MKRVKSNEQAEKQLKTLTRSIGRLTRAVDKLTVEITAHRRVLEIDEAVDEEVSEYQPPRSRLVTLPHLDYDDDDDEQTRH